LWGCLYVMIGAGAFDLALAELDSVTVPTNTPESMQVAGTLALCRSLPFFSSWLRDQFMRKGGPFDERHFNSRSRRASSGQSHWSRSLGGYREVAEFIDLCRYPHRSTYADTATMPRMSQGRVLVR
jgi:hypothetical protein